MAKAEGRGLESVGAVDSLGLAGGRVLWPFGDARPVGKVRFSFTTPRRANSQYMAKCWSPLRSTEFTYKRTAGDFVSSPVSVRIGLASVLAPRKPTIKSGKYMVMYK